MPTSTRAGVGGAVSITGVLVVSTTVALLFTLTTTGVGVNEESADATGLTAVAAGGEVTRTALTGSGAVVRGRVTTTFVLVDAGFSEYLDPCSVAPGLVAAPASCSVGGVGSGVGVAVAVADASAVGSEVGSVVSCSS
jgi:hypothetical protein